MVAMLLISCGGSSNALLNIQWQWSSITSGIAKQFIENSEDYVLVFREDGTFNGQVDCNVIAGTYEMNENELTLVLGPTTLAECGPDSLYDTFLGFLGLVNSYELEGGELTLFLSDGSTSLGFMDGGPAE